MTRHEWTVGAIRCPGDADTIKTIAAAAGLSARRVDHSDVFELANTGREIDHEITADLFAAVQLEFDRAVSAGVIPHWSIEQRTLS